MKAMHIMAGLSAAALASATPASAEVIAAQPGGFEVEEHVHLSAAPDQVWLALGQIGSWWIKDHTYSGDAHNLTIGLRAGDCFCERWSGGQVQHMTVVIALPGKMLRLEGGLGPLGGLGVAGHLTFRLKPAASGTDLTVTYDVGGWTKDGLAGLAPPVDGVLGAQVKSLAAFADGKRP